MNDAASPPDTLISFLTRNMSLDAWRRGGMLDRELALFRALAVRGWSVHLVSFGGRSDLALAPPGIRIHVNTLRLPPDLYVRWLALRLRRLPGRAVVRSNQVRGAELAAVFARRLGIPLVVRCGFLPSQVSGWALPRDARRHEADRDLERQVFGFAEHVVVSTAALADYVVGSYEVPAAKVSVVPNYVETDRFAPAPGRAEPGHVMYVGRLQEEKGPSLLLQALAGTPWRLTMIGEGPLRGALEREAAALGVEVCFEGTVPNALLPSRLQEASVFCLPSRYEGHPKALLEAMSCGVAVVATDAPGTRDVIRDGENGILCERDPAALRSALTSVLEDPERRRVLGVAARRFVLESCDLAGVVQREIDVLSAVKRT